MITCRRGSAKRAKHSITLMPTSCLCYLLTIILIGKQAASPYSIAIMSSSISLPPFRPDLTINPSCTITISYHRRATPSKSPRPNLSLLWSIYTTRSAPFLQFPEVHLPLAGMYQRPSYAPARLLPPYQFLEPHSTVSNELLPRSDCMAVLPSLSGEGKG